MMRGSFPTSVRGRCVSTCFEIGRDRLVAIDGERRVPGRDLDEDGATTTTTTNTIAHRTAMFSLPNHKSHETINQTMTKTHSRSGASVPSMTSATIASVNASTRVLCTLCSAFSNTQSRTLHSLDPSL